MANVTPYLLLRYKIGVPTRQLNPVAVPTRVGSSTRPRLAMPQGFRMNVLVVVRLVRYPLCQAVMVLALGCGQDGVKRKRRMTNCHELTTASSRHHDFLNVKHPYG